MVESKEKEKLDMGVKRLTHSAIQSAREVEPSTNKDAEICTYSRNPFKMFVMLFISITGQAMNMGQGFQQQGMQLMNQGQQLSQQMAGK